MSKTKIIVFQMKELVYTGIFVGLGILLIIILVVMFGSSGDKGASTDASQTMAQTEPITYTPGIYNSQMQLGETTLNLEVVVDETQIKSVSFVNLDESVATMYPLVEPSLEFLEEELVSGTPIDQIVVNEKSKYTQTMLLEGIKNALAKAVNSPEDPAASD